MFSETKTCTDNPVVDNIKLEVALQNIRAVCQARLEYNKHLYGFILESSAEDVKKYFLETLGFLFHEHTDSTLLKNVFSKSVHEDCRVYKSVLEKIDTEEHTQSLVDYLHFEFKKFLVVGRSVAQNEYSQMQQKHKKLKLKAKEVSKLIKKQKSESFREEDFLAECVSFLEDVISGAQQAFSREVSIGSIRYQANSIITLESKIFYKRLNNCKIMMKFLVEPRSYSLMKTKINQIIDDEVPVIQAIEPNPTQEVIIDWEKFHKIFALEKRLEPTYLRVNALVANSQVKAEASVSFAVEAQKRVPKKASIGESLAEAQQALTHEETPDLEEQARVEEKQDEKMIEEIKKQKEDQRQKIAEYKFKVEIERAARRALRLAQKKATRAIPLGEQESYFVMERKRQLSFSLLCNLNHSNLALVQLILSTPTPHLQISYAELENLFGYDKGKLNGSIASMHGGSHRKIVIHNIIGFFDTPLEKADPCTNTALIATGGTFKAHNPRHNNKLPSVAIKMLAETLKRAGIDAYTFNLFLTAKQKLPMVLAPEIDMKDICLRVLQAANILENDKGMLTFLRVIYKKENEKPAAIHQLSTLPESRTHILRKIFQCL